MHTDPLSGSKTRQTSCAFLTICLTAHLSAGRSLQEFQDLWESLMQALASGHKPLIAHAALTYVYYWYNFMPLARGTAVTGYITLLAIFLAADMPITSFIPKVGNSISFIPLFIDREPGSLN